MDRDVEKLRLALAKRLASKIAALIEATSPSNVNCGDPTENIGVTTNAPSMTSKKNRTRRRRVRRCSEHHAYKHRIVQILVEALLNPIHIDWDIEAYAAASASQRDRKFTHRPIGTHSKPATLVDINGVIVMWYLPGLLPNKLHHEVTTATLGINRLLSNSVKTGARAAGANWRVNKAQLVPKSRTRIISGGSVNFSGGWFAQGHTSRTHKLLPSLNLRTQIESKFWLRDIQNFEEYINAVLSLTHPRLFDNAKIVLHKLRDMNESKEITALWPSVFTGIAVIANRITPSHRDRGGRPAWYDTLLNTGSFTTAALRLPDLGAVFAYPPGTVVNLCGNIIKHQVSGWGPGDRVCYAHFMRDAVFRRFDVDRAGWVKQADFDGLHEFLRSRE